MSSTNTASPEAKTVPAIPSPTGTSVRTTTSAGRPRAAAMRRVRRSPTGSMMEPIVAWTVRIVLSSTPSRSSGGDGRPSRLTISVRASSFPSTSPKRVVEACSRSVISSSACPRLLSSATLPSAGTGAGSSLALCPPASPRMARARAASREISVNVWETTRHPRIDTSAANPSPSAI